MEYRKVSGELFLKECKSELDKLIDSSQTIPRDLVNKYSVIAESQGLRQPEIQIVNTKSFFDYFVISKKGNNNDLESHPINNKK